MAIAMATMPRGRAWGKRILASLWADLHRCGVTSILFADKFMEWLVTQRDYGMGIVDFDGYLGRRWNSALFTSLWGPWLFWRFASQMMWMWRLFMKSRFNNGQYLAAWRCSRWIKCRTMKRLPKSRQWDEEWIDHGQCRGDQRLLQRHDVVRSYFPWFFYWGACVQDVDRDSLGKLRSAVKCFE